MMEDYDKYVGKTIDGRFKIERVIGSGGMSVVFKAEDTVLNKTVAVKLLKEDKQNDPAYIRSFINESKAVAMLSHENIVHIYDVSVKDKIQYIVMEYIEGITLKNYLKRKGGILDWRETLSITEQILRALDHAHSKGVIHRDIKPQNIMLLRNGLIKVADFGIAKLPENDTMTNTNRAIGTVHYISPEQARSEQIDAKSDLYSVGVMMYELACGKLPFTAESPVSVALKQVGEQAVPPRTVNPELPIGMEQIIVRAMEKNPERRYQSAKAMLKHVTALKENPKLRFRNPNDEKHEEEEDETVIVPSGKHVVVEGRSVLPIILGVLSSFLIVAVIIAFRVFDKLSESMTDTNSKTVVVEDYVGKILDDSLRSQLEDMGYRIKEYTGAGDEGSILNEIVEQSIAPGSSEKYIPNEKYIDITFYVYKGSNTVKLPDFTYREYSAVKTEYMNMYDIKVERIYDNYVPSGYIIRTEPAAGSDVTVGSQLKLYVSNGIDSSSTKKVKMQSLVGMTSAEARNWLIDNGLKLGYINFEESAEYDKDVITYQSVNVGTEIAEGTAVDITVSLGKYVIMIDMYGMSEDDAKQWIEDNGLTLGEVKYKRADEEDYTVIYQSIDPDEKAEADTTVDLNICSHNVFDWLL